MGKFEIFLFNEGQNYLGRRIANVLTPIQELQDDMQNMGSRHLIRNAENIVNEIRKILHGSWEHQHLPHLRELQKIAVAIQKTIEDKGDLKEIIPAATQALQTLSGKLGVKVNNLKAPEENAGEPVSDADFQETPPPQMNQQMPQAGNYSG